MTQLLRFALRLDRASGLSLTARRLLFDGPDNGIGDGSRVFAQCRHEGAAVFFWQGGVPRKQRKHRGVATVDQFHFLILAR